MENNETHSPQSSSSESQGVSAQEETCRKCCRKCSCSGWQRWVWRFTTIVWSAVFGVLGAVAVLILLPRLATFPHGQAVIQKLGLASLDGVSNQKTQAVSVAGSADDEHIIQTVEKVDPSVVSIVITKDIPRLQRMMPFGFPFLPFDDGTGSGNEWGFGDGQGQNQGVNGGGNGSTKQRVGAGSGFFVSSDGLIATNKHVVSDTSAEYTVITSDGKEHPAKVVAKDPVRDIAIIKIEDSQYPALAMGDSDAIRVGQTVIAVGNSLGEFSNTVSKGIISGKQRDLTASSSDLGQSEHLTNIIQTDAAINPGNSGGPLLDADGQVIGINVAIAEGAQSVGFAIPVNQVKKIVSQVQSTGKISTPFLGVRYVIVDDKLKEENNLPFEYGVIIARGSKQTDFAVIPGSPADRAGLSENDIILELNGQKIDNNHQLADLLSGYNPGETVTLKVWHKGETKEVPVTLDERK